jgi:hypothetical protein
MDLFYSLTSHPLIKTSKSLEKTLFFDIEFLFLKNKNLIIKGDEVDVDVGTRNGLGHGTGNTDKTEILFENGVDVVEVTDVKWCSDAALHFFLIFVIFTQNFFSFLLLYAILRHEKKSPLNKFHCLDKKKQKNKIFLRVVDPPITKIFKPFQSCHHRASYSKCKLLDFVPWKDKIS